MYSWLHRRIQPLQNFTRFGCEYLGILDPSQFSAVGIGNDEALLWVSRILMGTEIVPYVAKLYSAKYPPKQVGVSSRILLSSTSDVF
jgi:hypothetical protein